MADERPEKRALLALQRQALDPDIRTTDLLRTALFFSGLVKAEQLASWARWELDGYPPDEELPVYRRLYATIGGSYVSGNFHAQGASFSWHDLPAEARGDGPEALELRGPLREIEALAGSGEFARMQSVRLEYAKALWNRSLGPFQQIQSLYYNVSSAALEGVGDQVRTLLVSVVADMGVDPLSLGPVEQGKRLDASVAVQIFNGGTDMGDKYSIQVRENSGVIGQGASVQQHVGNDSTSRLTDALQKIQVEIDQMADDEDRADLQMTVNDFQNAALESPRDPEIVETRGRQLLRAATQVGTAALTTAVNAAISASLS